MTELSARIGLYAGVDRAASQERGRLEAAAAVLPVYRLDLEPAPPDVDTRRWGTVGWHRHLHELSPDLRLPPSIERALAELGSLERPSALDQAQRLRAAWAVVRVVPDTDRDLVAGTLAPLVRSAVDEHRGSAAVGAGEISERARRLTDLLADSERFPSAEAWPRLVEAVFDVGFMSGEVAGLAQVTCHDEVTYAPLPDGDVDPAPEITTQVLGFDVGERSLDDLRAALQPHNWPQCLEHFWCDMREIEPTPTMNAEKLTWYQEEVGECPDLWFDPYLVFGTRELTDGRAGFGIQYGLCPPADLDSLNTDRITPLEQDTRVQADTGELIVVIRQKPGAPPGHHEIDMTTTKTILFGDSLPNGGVALLACVTGWGDQTRMMLSGCLGT